MTCDGVPLSPGNGTRMLPGSPAKGAVAMPTIRLTQRGVDTLKPPASGRVEYWDAHLPGFGLRVSAPGPKNKGQGLKTWITMYRVAGKQYRETIGTLAVIPK